jgi:hypothetical protein
MRGEHERENHSLGASWIAPQLKREHPTGTERKLLNYECGWKGGDRGGLAERKNEKISERE